MKALGFDLPKDQVISVLHKHGVPSENSSRLYRLLIPLPQFQAMIAQRILARDPKEEISRAFALFDESSKGRIDLQDLRRVASLLGEGLGEEELAAMIDEFDLDNDGAISQEEFLDICL